MLFTLFSSLLTALTFALPIPQFKSHPATTLPLQFSGDFFLILEEELRNIHNDLRFTGPPSLQKGIYLTSEKSFDFSIWF